MPPHDSFNAIEPSFQMLHLGAIAQSDKVVTWAVEEIPPFGRIQVKEDARHNDDFFFQTLLEEVQPIIDLCRESTQIQPDVEC